MQQYNNSPRRYDICAQKLQCVNFYAQKIAQTFQAKQPETPIDTRLTIKKISSKLSLILIILNLKHTIFCDIKQRQIEFASKI